MARNTVRIQSDDRTRYEHQAYDVTYAGRSKETSPLGYQSRLSATYEANFQISVDAGTVAVHEFTLPPYVYSNGFIVVEGSSGAPTATLEVSDIDGGNAVTLAAALDLSSPSATKVPYDGGVIIDVEPADQKVTLSITGGTGSGVATLVLQASIMQTSWK